jgi:hypothetical protein
VIDETYTNRAAEAMRGLSEAMKPIARQARVVERRLNRFNRTLLFSRRANELWTKAHHFETPSWQRPFHRLRWRYFIWKHGKEIQRR